MKLLKFLIIAVLFIGCNSKKSKHKIVGNNTVEVEKPQLNLEQANRLLQLPLHCVNVEYPNKLNQTIGSGEDLKSPKELHPTFYGCFDWHSSVHGHWSLVSLLKNFPEVKEAAKAKEILLASISKENILQEVAYFDGKYNKSYERTYGWAWLLKLAEELHTWDDSSAKQLEENLQPLTDLIVRKYLEFLPKLNYPIRVGEHTNTAFGLTFAWDYANTVKNNELLELINKRAKDFFMDDENCPISWEPSGFDFLSACLQEAAIMKRVLPKNEFKKWISDFLPQLNDKNFTLAVGEVSDRSDGKLVHLDGVNFSRAWCLNTISKDLPEYNHLKNTANQHINYSLPNVVGDSYEGGHWLGSFAIYALNSMGND
ncbi:Protein of unknown function (DUF2891) [Lutibacter sp. Hel_I_33_5]|uniref:DUF2891 domain-containing protein n=1 Tax=Lutibacter sp. Hel_I_33_5 TaxID=1566289 RepID=UPI0011A10A41|nr:DUF2891 domain-containing protein [Lutibacter sp. Hel_I_33_5]TVZ55907.1 Protein of unknown function (DUF2891) [Lutibacter sp. Hel_I_33_5]